MDYQYNTQNSNENKRRSARMEAAAFYLGTAAIAGSCLVYPAFICGSLAILFALLSRGGETAMTARAKIGLILGSIALGIMLLMFINYIFIYVNYEEVSNMMKQLYGIDLDTLIDYPTF